MEYSFSSVNLSVSEIKRVVFQLPKFYMKPRLSDCDIKTEEESRGISAKTPGYGTISFFIITREVPLDFESTKNVTYDLKFH